MVSLNIRPSSAAPEIEDFDREALIETIKEWFFANYEDPAENTPYESREGGYQYIWGGPYDAREEIEIHFTDVPEDVIEEIVGELEGTAVDWAPNSNRIFDEDPPDNGGQTSYEELQLRLNELERVIAKINPISSLIGSNHPPEDIGVPPYRDEDKQQIEQAVAILRAPEDQLVQNAKQTIEVAEILKTKGEKLREFFARHGDKFVESFSSQLGKRAADSVTFALWIKLGGALIAVYEAAKWLLQAAGSISIPF